MQAGGAAELEVRPAAQAAYNARVQEQMRGTVWTEAGCASWYLDAKGRNTTLWPTFTWPFRVRTRRLDRRTTSRARAPGARARRRLKARERIATVTLM